MLVFISWSGPRSRGVAAALRDWLPNVLQAIEPWMSDEDLYAGGRWLQEIGDRLEQSSFGVVVVTAENQGAPWLNFEAGAIAKNVGTSRVVPLRVGVNASDVKPPLDQFQNVGDDQSGLEKLVISLNQQLGDSALPEARVKAAVAKWYEDLFNKMAMQELAAPVPEEPHRTVEDMVGELLERMRDLQRTFGGPTPPTFLQQWFDQQMRGN